jgi:hypothetical protein
MRRDAATSGLAGTSEPRTLCGLRGAMRYSEIQLQNPGLATNGGKSNGPRQKPTLPGMREGWGAPKSNCEDERRLALVVEGCATRLRLVS